MKYSLHGIKLERDIFYTCNINVSKWYLVKQKCIINFLIIVQRQHHGMHITFLFLPWSVHNNWCLEREYSSTDQTLYHLKLRPQTLHVLWWHYQLSFSYNELHTFVSKRYFLSPFKVMIIIISGDSSFTTSIIYDRSSKFD